ncbi:hypothetical protein KXD97_03650 [Mycobacterium sp. SMC-8]|nr:hypothetical protein KXD97_03650 [Mycobacterium sp. SMC-8]
MGTADSRVHRRGRNRRDMTPVAITDEDLPEVADFLRDNHDGNIRWMQACASAQWQVDRPNHGFMLKDGQRVVGAVLALYSERVREGRVERFCNIGTWCVLAEYRSASMSLVNAILAQDSYHFTVLTPNRGSQEILAWMKFSFLDTAAALIPNVPWPSVPRRTRVITDHRDIENTLVGAELQLYRDHARALAARHVVLVHGDETGYVMYREFRHGSGLGYAMILYVSDTALFHRALVPLTRHLLMRRGLVATLIERRVIGGEPGLPLMSFRLRDRPKMYRGAGLEPHQIDYLYSELACVPW